MTDKLSGLSDDVKNEIFKLFTKKELRSGKLVSKDFNKKATKIIAKNLSKIEKLNNDVSLSIYLSLDSKTLCGMVSTSTDMAHKILPALRTLTYKYAKVDPYTKGIVAFKLIPKLYSPLCKKIISILMEVIYNSMDGFGSGSEVEWDMFTEIGECVSYADIKKLISSTNSKELCVILEDAQYHGV